VVKLPTVAVTTATAAATIVVSLLLACSTAVRTTLWFVSETLLLVESLFALTENELCSAILTINCFIWHLKRLLKIF
jgi:hypothetical protein